MDRLADGPIEEATVKIIDSIPTMQTTAQKIRRHGSSLGFIPTMGAIHQGHLSLIQRARRENDVVVVSLFVNPLQFGAQEDFKKYPRPITKDAALLKKEKVDFLFMPNAREMVPNGFVSKILMPGIDDTLEGAARPGHFQGVATIVAKLFNIVQPARAYFGQKDYQQVRVVARMIEDLNIPVHLIACPTVREKDGLACSSRNRFLSKLEREEAVKIYQALYLGRELISGRIMKNADQVTKRLSQVFLKTPHCKIDYIALVDLETMEPMKKLETPALLAVAVRIGKTRLIDNVIIP